MGSQVSRNTSNTGISYITAFTFIYGTTGISGISASASIICITYAIYPQ